jgi:hypothetical protein
MPVTSRLRRLRPRRSSLLAPLGRLAQLPAVDVLDALELPDLAHHSVEADQQGGQSLTESARNRAGETDDGARTPTAG